MLDADVDPNATGNTLTIASSGDNGAIQANLIAASMSPRNATLEAQFSRQENPHPATQPGGRLELAAQVQSIPMAASPPAQIGGRPPIPYPSIGTAQGPGKDSAELLTISGVHATEQIYLRPNPNGTADRIASGVLKANGANQ
jgi:hypothetical protein